MENKQSKLKAIKLIMLISVSFTAMHASSEAGAGVGRDEECVSRKRPKMSHAEMELLTEAQKAAFVEDLYACANEEQAIINVVNRYFGWAYEMMLTGVRVTPEGKPTEGVFFGELTAYGNPDVIELMKSMRSLKCLLHVLKNEYRQFGGTLLESAFGKEVTDFGALSLEQIYSHIEKIIIGDLGKTKALERIVNADRASKGLDSLGEHDAIRDFAIKNGLIPVRPPTESSIDGISDKTNFGQLVQGECLPWNLKEWGLVDLVASGNIAAVKEGLRNFKIDLWGTKAHMQTGANFAGFLAQLCRDAEGILISAAEKCGREESIDLDQLANEIYYASLEKKAVSLGFSYIGSYGHLSRAILRQFALLRIANLQDAQIISDVLNEHSEETQYFKNVMNSETLFYYLPAYLLAQKGSDLFTKEKYIEMINGFNAIARRVEEQGIAGKVTVDIGALVKDATLAECDLVNFGDQWRFVKTAA